MAESSGLRTIGSAPFIQEEPTELKVLVYDEPFFLLEYGGFLREHKDVRLTVVDAGHAASSRAEPRRWIEEIAKMIEAEKPDVLFMWDTLYEHLQSKRMLGRLDANDGQELLDDDPMARAMAEHMKNGSGGALYAIPLDFESRVLYYNKDLFDRFGVAHPQEGIRWSDALALAERFPNDGNLCGFSIKDCYAAARALASAAPVLSPCGTGVSFDSVEWQGAFRRLFALLRSQAVYKPDEALLKEAMRKDDPFAEVLRTDRFLIGTAAMTVETAAYIRYGILEAETVLTGESVPRNWAVVPILESAIEPLQLVAVREGSKRRRAAAKLIKYCLSHSRSLTFIKSLHDTIPNAEALYRAPSGLVIDPDKKLPAELYTLLYNDVIDPVVDAVKQRAFDGRRSDPSDSAKGAGSVETHRRRPKLRRIPATQNERALPVHFFSLLRLIALSI